MLMGLRPNIVLRAEFSVLGVQMVNGPTYGVGFVGQNKETY
jgi:hypothetical protein